MIRKMQNPDINRIADIWLKTNLKAHDFIPEQYWTSTSQFNLSGMDRQIDTDFIEYTRADAVQQPVHRVGNPMDIINMVLFLCSEKAGFITGENICIDGGMTKQMIYHGDCGWRLDMSLDMKSKKQNRKENVRKGILMIL